MDDILPAIEKQLYFGRVNNIGKHVKSLTFSDDTEKNTDETYPLVFHVLELYKRLMKTCPNMLVDKKYVSNVQRIAGRNYTFDTNDEVFANQIFRIQL